MLTRLYTSWISFLVPKQMEIDIKKAVNSSGKSIHQWIREAVSAKLKEEGK